MFITDFILGPKGADYLKEVSPDSKNPITPTRFATLSNDEKNDRD